MKRLLTSMTAFGLIICMLGLSGCASQTAGNSQTGGNGPSPTPQLAAGK